MSYQLGYSSVSAADHESFAVSLTEFIGG